MELSEIFLTSKYNFHLTHEETNLIKLFFRLSRLLLSLTEILSMIPVKMGKKQTVKRNIFPVKSKRFFMLQWFKVDGKSKHNKN